MNHSLISKGVISLTAVAGTLGGVATVPPSTVRSDSSVEVREQPGGLTAPVRSSRPEEKPQTLPQFPVTGEPVVLLFTFSVIIVVFSCTFALSSVIYSE